MDADSQWRAPITTSKTYTAGTWVYATKTVKITLYVDVLDAQGNYLTTLGGTTLTLTANTWTQLKLPTVKTTNTNAAYLVMEPNFSSATTGTVIYWDDMSLTTN